MWQLAMKKVQILMMEDQQLQQEAYNLLAFCGLTQQLEVRELADRNDLSGQEGGVIRREGLRARLILALSVKSRPGWSASGR